MKYFRIEIARTGKFHVFSVLGNILQMSEIVFPPCTIPVLSINGYYSRMIVNAIDDLDIIRHHNRTSRNAEYIQADLRPSLNLKQYKVSFATRVIISIENYSYLFKS